MHSSIIITEPYFYQYTVPEIVSSSSARGHIEGVAVGPVVSLCHPVGARSCWGLILVSQEETLTVISEIGLRINKYTHK